MVHVFPFVNRPLTGHVIGLLSKWVYSNVRKFFNQMLSDVGMSLTKDWQLFYIYYLFKLHWNVCCIVCHYEGFKKKIYIKANMVVRVPHYHRLRYVA